MSAGCARTAVTSPGLVTYEPLTAALTYHCPFSSMQATGEKLPLLFRART
jgi:hypothetical protein